MTVPTPVTNAGMPLVHAVNVMKAFDGNQVLKGIDLDVHKGQVVCLLGPSGSGKTTFLRCINQLETIDGGRIWVDGDLMGYEERGDKLHHLTSKAIAAQRREIGMVFQRFNLFPHMTRSRARTRLRSASGLSPCWSELACRTSLLRIPPSSRAVNSSVSQSPAPWPCSPS
jgi:ABC-type phosphate/phosphonate transport system ATPase subunit